MLTALIALFQLSSRHHGAFPDAAVLPLCFSTEHNNICFSPWLLWASECSIIHSTSHCSSPNPRFPPSFLWPRWTWLVWPRLSLEEWDEEGGALCHLHRSLLCAPFTRKHAQCLHVHATPSLRCAQAIRKHQVITVHTRCASVLLLLSSTSVCSTMIFFPVGKQQRLVKILFLALYYVDYISDAAERKKIVDYWMRAVRDTVWWKYIEIAWLPICLNQRCIWGSLETVTPCTPESTDKFIFQL